MDARFKLSWSDLCFRSALLASLTALAIVLSVSTTSMLSDLSESEYWIVLGHRLKITDLLLVVFNGLLFIATAALVGATLFLWKATRDLVAGAEHTAIRQLRAYLFVTPKSVKLERVPGAARALMTVQFELENTGQTPAHHVLLPKRSCKLASRKDLGARMRLGRFGWNQ